MSLVRMIQTAAWSQEHLGRLNPIHVLAVSLVGLIALSNWVV